MDYETKTICVEITIYTNKDNEQSFNAIKKGIYYGLDVRNVASPKDVVSITQITPTSKKSINQITPPRGKNLKK